jgi:hypothetical protein
MKTEAGKKVEVTAFAKVEWHTEDVRTLLERGNHVIDEMSDADIEEFFDCCERHLQDRLVEAGWDVLDQLLNDWLAGKEELNVL